jgi:hypothetical protein
MWNLPGLPCGEAGCQANSCASLDLQKRLSGKPRDAPSLVLSSRHASHEVACSSCWSQFTLLDIIGCCLCLQAAMASKHVFPPLERGLARRCLTQSSLALTPHTTSASNSIITQAAAVQRRDSAGHSANTYPELFSLLRSFHLTNSITT